MTKIATSHKAEIRKWEATAMADGKISVAEAKDLKALVGKPTKDDQALLKDLFAHDRFDPAAKKGAVLKAAGLAKGTKVSPAVGTEVAPGVFARKSFSPVNGHTTKLQAYAAARLAGVANAAVVPDQNGRWHAVELTKAMPATGAMNGAVGVTKLDEKAYAALAATARTTTDLATRTDALKQLASAAYGVPMDDVNVMKPGAAPIAGKVNINVDKKDLSGAGRLTAACSCAAHTNFKQGAEPAIEIRADTLATPKQAAATMFHESTHADDFAAAQKVAKAYAAQKPDDAKALDAIDFTRKDSDLSPAELKAKLSALSKFQVWIHDPKNKDLKGMTDVERSKLQGYMTSQTGASEATAYTKTWMQAFASAPKGTSTYDLAGELLTWANGQTSGKIPLSQAGSQEWKADLDAFYAKLTPDDQTRFKDALAYVQTRNPKAQIADYTPPD